MYSFLELLLRVELFIIMLWPTNLQIPNQLETSQRILNILHLLLWTPLYLWILFLRLIVILAYVQTTHPLHLCNIRSMHIHTILILHIFLNLLISSLLLWCIIPLFFKLHHNLLHIISRQQYHRLNMPRIRKHIHAAPLLNLIPTLL